MRRTQSRGVQRTVRSVVEDRAGTPTLVSAKGFAEHADVRVPDEFDTGTYRQVRLDPTAWCTRHGRAVAERVTDGALVWVKTDHLAAFCAAVLPAISEEFVLVTGDWDHPIPRYATDEAAVLLPDERVRHWFTMQIDETADGDRMSPIPLGVDYHTLANGPTWGESREDRADQEARLLGIAARLPPLGERAPRAWADFGWRRQEGLVEFGETRLLRPDRAEQADLFDQLPAVYVQDEPLTRTDLWCQRGSTAAVVCPRGYGEDTHRLWEGLALGHLAVVGRSALTPLYDGLPVVEVDDWTDVTPANLERWLVEAPRPGPEPAPQLTIAWWVEQIRAVAAPPTSSRSDDRARTVQLIGDDAALPGWRGRLAAAGVEVTVRSDATSPVGGVVSVGAPEDAAHDEARRTADDEGVPWAAVIEGSGTVPSTDRLPTADVLVADDEGTAALLRSAGVPARRVLDDEPDSLVGLLGD